MDRARSHKISRSLPAVLIVAAAVFITLTILVTSNASLAMDSAAFRVARQLREPWLDHAARLITTLGLLAVVGPVLLVSALLIRRRRPPWAAALVGGAALTSAGVWITKAVVDRPRPPAALVHTAGQSYPSAHAANAVGWLALAIAVSTSLASRGARVAAIAGGASVAALVGLSRIYLRAHYLSDVLAGEALATVMYAATAIGALSWQLRRRGGPTVEQSSAASR